MANGIETVADLVNISPSLLTSINGLGARCCRFESCHFDQDPGSNVHAKRALAKMQVLFSHSITVCI